MKRRQFVWLFALGMIGVITLAFTFPEPLVAEAGRDFPNLPRAAVIAMLLINPTLYLALGTFAGVRLAPRVGLRSHVANAVAGQIPPWSTIRRDALIAFASGAAAAVVTVLADYAFEPLVREAWRVEDQTARGFGETISGILYGGITEELMLRWGLLTFFVWVVARRRLRSGGAPTARVYWIAIVVAAVLFGAGHLGAASAMATLTVAMVARVVLLNAAAGLVFGWLYWRRSLEAAMIAHATGHVVFMIAAAVAD